MTVTLSIPPLALAVSISFLAAASRPEVFWRIACIISSETMPERPSEQSMKMSPGCGWKALTSTSTIFCWPSARRMMFFCGDLAQPQVFLDQGVIDGDALEAPVPEQVDPAVADVGDERLRARAVALDEVHHHRGGAHVLLRAVLLALLDDALVGQLDGGDGAVLVVALLAVGLERPGGVLVLAGEAEELLHLVDRDGAGHLARRVAAHPVEDGEHVLLGEHEEVVLVVVPLHADVGLCCVVDSHGAQGLRRAGTRLPPT